MTSVNTLRGRPPDLREDAPYAVGWGAARPLPPSGLPGGAPTPDRSKDPRKYVRILNYLRGELDDGLLRPGMQAPTLDALARQFGCNRHTAAKALRLLADEGLLVRYLGLGYYVAERL